MQFTKIPADTFKKLQLNAGIMADDFTPATGEIGNILAATSGGINFNASPTFEDFGEDVDNAPKNSKELKRQTEIAVTISGTMLTVDAAGVARLMSAATITEGESGAPTKITPKLDLSLSDFKTIWFIGDYSDEDGGFIAIELIDVLSTGGFQLQTADKGKGQFSFEFTAHTSIADPSAVPYSVYILEPAAEETTVEETNATSSALRKTTTVKNETKEANV